MVVVCDGSREMGSGKWEVGVLFPKQRAHGL